MDEVAGAAAARTDPLDTAKVAGPRPAGFTARAVGWGFMIAAFASILIGALLESGQLLAVTPEEVLQNAWQAAGNAYAQSLYSWVQIQAQINTVAAARSAANTAAPPSQ